MRTPDGPEELPQVAVRRVNGNAGKTPGRGRIFARDPCDGPGDVPAVRRLRDHVRKSAGTSTLANNWYRRNDAVDFLQVSHYINPTAYGFPAERERSWIQSAWHANAVGDGSPRRRFVDAVKTFGEKYRDAVRKGFRNRLGSGESGLKFSFER